MSSNDPFKILGLRRNEATKASVKKAYSVKLKETRPDDDPEGFMALREAYEQASNIVRWQENNPELEVVLSTEDGEATAEPEEIKYWYDEKYNFNFNSSPLGQLIERTVKWIFDSKADAPDEFFKEMKAEALFKDKNELNEYSRFLVGRIFYESGGDDDYYEDDEIDDNPEYERPVWLSDDVIISIHHNFDFLHRNPEYEWEALQLNCIKILFEPVLLEHGLITKATNKHDLVEYRAREIEQYNKDDYGSYYDKKERQWVDMSPVGVAMRDIEALIETPWAGSSKVAWEEILSRDEVQYIDEFQLLDTRLRQFVCQKTGYENSDSPLKKPDWLNEEVVLLLDDTFGWNHQSGRHMWEHEQYKWLQRIIGEYRRPTTFNYGTGSWQGGDNYETSDFKRFLSYFRPEYIFGYYLFYRVSQAILRMVY